jgi:hypothetical protein
LSNIRLSFAGGGTADEASRAVPEEADKYPEYAMFGRLPAYGLYCRHVNGLKLTNVQLQLANDDKRHAVVLEDVKDATIDGLDAPYSSGAASLLRLTGVQNTLIRGCMPQAATELFVRVQGAGTEGVTLLGNDFRRIKKVIEADAEVPQAAVAQVANRMN